jgi:hypothetical protein
MSEKSFSPIDLSKSKLHNQQKKDKYTEHKSYNHKYTQYYKNNYDDPYNQRQKINYDNPRQDDKSYHQQKAKQAQTMSVYKYKIERDKSGNCSYVLEEPVHNPIKVINDYEIKCVYPNNGTKYYKNINIYNYKKKIII